MHLARRPTTRRVLLLLGVLVAWVAIVRAAVWSGASRGADEGTAPPSARVAGRFRLPWEPSPDGQYPPAAECARCHPTQVGEWQVSTHARAARNPLVHASVCGRCHAPLGTQLDAEYQLKLYDQTPMPGLPASAAEGITCITCHNPTHTAEEQVFAFLPTWPNWRATDLALEILPYEKAIGAFGTGTADDPLPVANDSHPSEADPTFRRAELCRACHSATIDKAPLAPHCGIAQPRVALLTTYEEWAAGPYPSTDQPCQSCHMPEEAQGPAAIAPEGTDYRQPLPMRALHNHSFAGLSSDYLAAGPDVAAQEARVAARLKDAAVVALSVPATATLGVPLEFTVTVTNTGAGHQLPTGFAYWSEAWFEITATDADGRVLFASGDVDTEGWLRDEFNPRVVDGTLPYDAYLVSLRARLVSVGANRTRWLQPDGTLRIPPDEVPQNLNGTPILGLSYDVAAMILRRIRADTILPTAGIALQEGYVLRFADTILRYGIPPQKARQARYPLLLDTAARGPIHVSARLLIRSQWPWMLGQQEELPTPRPRPRVFEIASADASVAVPAP